VPNYHKLKIEIAEKNLKNLPDNNELLILISSVTSWDAEGRLTKD